MVHNGLFESIFSKNLQSVQRLYFVAVHLKSDKSGAFEVKLPMLTSETSF